MSTWDDIQQHDVSWMIDMVKQDMEVGFFNVVNPQIAKEHADTVKHPDELRELLIELHDDDGFMAEMYFNGFYEG